MRLFRSIVGLFMACLVLSMAKAQVTVFDAPNEIHFAATVETLKAELEQVRAVSAAINGVRELGPELRTLPASSILPSDLLLAYRSLVPQGFAAAGAACVGRDAASVSVCRFDAAKTPLDLSLAAALYAEAPSRQQELSSLQSAALASVDLKSSTDLATRTSLSAASLDAERLQVELFALQSQLQEEAIAKARRLDQLERVTTGARAIDSIAPMDFGTGAP